MTFDEMMNALKTATAEPPRAALAASAPHAAALAPEVYSRIDKLCRGVYLMPPDANIVFYGLYVLAAARDPGLWPRLVNLARLQDGALEDILPLKADTALTQLMLSVWDGDGDALFHLIEHADLDPLAKWALFDVLARLTFDGRIERGRCTDFLELYERDGLADDTDYAWWGWESAVSKLGLLDLEPAIHRAWTKAVFKEQSKQERDRVLADLHQSGARPGDVAPFEKAEIVPLASAMAIADWLDEHTEMIARLTAKDGVETGQEPPDEDPAGGIRLSPFEQSWLDGFLASRQVPAGTMSLEMLDGFLTALVTGPQLEPFTRHLGEIFASDDGTALAWESTEQANYVLDLISRLSNSIAARRLADALQRPLLEAVDPDIAGSDWADGFLLGVDLGEEQWEPMWENPRGEAILAAIEALIGGGAEAEPPLTRKERAHTLERLPSMLQRIAIFWKDPSAGFKGSAPVRAQKIGRNDPCPCGSGQKYKKCCALKPPPVTH